MGKQRHQESQKYLYLVTSEKYHIYAVRLTCSLWETSQLKPGLALAKEPAPSHQSPSRCLEFKAAAGVEEISLEQSRTFLEQELIPPSPRAATRTTGGTRGQEGLGLPNSQSSAHRTRANKIKI